MANEIKLAGAGTGKTLYAVVISPAGTVYNGSTFEAYNASNWATYDIALSEVGAGIYFGTFPVVAAGLYFVVVYERLGASPAVTDTYTGGSNLDWNGTQEASLAEAPGTITRNVALDDFEFLMVSSADHVTPTTGLTVTATRSLDGAAFAACANAATEVGSGVYKIDLAAVDLNAAVITFRFTAPGADARLVTIVT